MTPEEKIKRLTYNVNDFIEDVFRIAGEKGYKIETSRKDNLKQIDFGHKKLHEGHIRELYPEALVEESNLNMLIDRVAPGRPCVHVPFRKIIEQLRAEKKSNKRGV